MANRNRNYRDYDDYDPRLAPVPYSEGSGKGAILLSVLATLTTVAILFLALKDFMQASQIQNLIETYPATQLEIQDLREKLCTLEKDGAFIKEQVSFEASQRADFKAQYSNDNFKTTLKKDVKRFCAKRVENMAGRAIDKSLGKAIGSLFGRKKPEITVNPSNEQTSTDTAQQRQEINPRPSSNVNQSFQFNGTDETTRGIELTGLINYTNAINARLGFVETQQQTSQQTIIAIKASVERVARKVNTNTDVVKSAETQNTIEMTGNRARDRKMVALKEKQDELQELLAMLTASNDKLTEDLANLTERLNEIREREPINP